MKRLFLLKMSFLMALCSCSLVSTITSHKGTASKKSQRKIASAWDKKNIPENIVVRGANASNLVRKFDKLEMKGSLSTLPWTGDYWASYRGGISYRWNNRLLDKDHKSRYEYKIGKAPEGDLNKLSPAEKWDLFVGDKRFSLTRAERRRVGLGVRKIPRWEGLCHAWAPATVKYKNPVKEVKKRTRDGRSITFYSSDIKALLTYFLHWDNPRNGGQGRSLSSFLGSRCSATIKELRDAYSSLLGWSPFSALRPYTKYLKGACGDTNAGSFHLVLTNLIGSRKKSFMMDVTRTQEVWNQAVYKYESEILKEREGSSSGAAQGTVREKDILSKVWYVSEPLFPFSKDGLTSLKGKPIYTEKSALDEKWYFYRVELDKDNKIIGGEWLKPGDYSSYFEKGISSDDDRFFEDRPDFLWDETPPVFYGRFSKLKNLYEASTGKETTEASPPTPTDYMMGLNRGILKVNNYFTKKIKKRVGLFRKKVDEFNLVGEMTYEGKGELIFWRMKRLTGSKEEIQPRIPFDSIESSGKFHAKFTLSSLQKINTSRITLGLMVDGKIIDSLSYRFEDLANLLDQ